MIEIRNLIRLVLISALSIVIPSCSEKKYSLYDMPGFDLGTRPDLINHQAIKRIPPNFQSNQAPFIQQQEFNSQFQKTDLPFYDPYYGSYNFNPSSIGYDNPYNFQFQSSASPYYDLERYYSLPESYQNIEYNHSL